MNYLFKQEYWIFNNGSRACKIDIRELDFEKLKTPNKWFLDYFNFVDRNEFGHGEEIECGFIYYLVYKMLIMGLTEWLII